MKNSVTIILVSILILSSCGRNSFEHDASGVFEATEVIISSETAGKIEELNVVEGDWLTNGQYVGYIDTVQLYLQKLQLQSTTKAVSARRPDVSTQIASIKEQIVKAEIEERRITNLLKDGAATAKQLDDINSQLAVLKKSLAAQLNSLNTSVNSLNQESGAYEIQVARIDDQLQKSRIINPMEGMVLSKYAEAKEMATVGKPLYRIADTKHLFLRAYIISNQLNEIKIGQKVAVFINLSDSEHKTYEGTISWISGKAEFTPKTIQTKDERQNLVYAVKIAVDNTDGLIKIGMYGDVDFNSVQ